MTTIKNKSGTFEGLAISSKISQFLGIKYANSTRFCEPLDILTYEKGVDARNFGPQSPQVPGFMEQILNTKDLPTSEDCLYLNIWSPTDRTTLRPVLFWIHGGAYTNGTGATSWYNGKNLAELGNVVVVTINYRLGPFGFMGDENFGTLDQISALRWVNRNIEAFGGDTNNVTIFGESAGGSSVVALTASPLTRGLINKAWAMSPSMRQLRTSSEANDALKKFLQAAKCNTVNELAELTTQQMIDATSQMFVDVENYVSTFTPTCGGTGLPIDVNSASADSKIPLVVGTNRDENRLWTALNPAAAQIDESAAKKYFKAAIPDSTNEAWLVYTNLRPDHSPTQMVAAMQTDQNFRSPAWDLCETRSNQQAKTWMYWFTWPTPVFDGAFGCCHALDLPFMFHNLDAPNVEMFTGAGLDRQKIADHFTSELLQFASAGDVTWPMYDTTSRQTLQIDVDKSVISNPEPQIRELWKINK